MNNILQSELSYLKPILAGVPEWAILSPKIYILYTAHQQTHPNTTVAEYAENKVIFASHSDPKISFIIRAKSFKLTVPLVLSLGGKNQSAQYLHKNKVHLPQTS